MQYIIKVMFEVHILFFHSPLIKKKNHYFFLKKEYSYMIRHLTQHFTIRAKPHKGLSNKKRKLVKEYDSSKIKAIAWSKSLSSQILPTFMTLSLEHC